MKLFKFNNINPISNHRGFSLIEIAITVGIVAFISMGANHLLMEQAKYKMGMLHAVNVNDLNQDLARIFNDTQLCTTALQGVSTTTGTNVSIAKDIMGSEIWDKDAAAGTSPYKNIEIASLKVAATATYGGKNVSTIAIKYEPNSNKVRSVIPEARFSVSYIDNGDNTFGKCIGYNETDFDSEQYCSGSWNPGPPPFCDTCIPLGGYWLNGICKIVNFAPPPDGE